MKRFICSVIFLSLVLASCTKEEVQKEEVIKEPPSQKEVSFSHNGQNFKIISFFEEVIDYTNYVKENPATSNNGAYVEKVLEPIKEKSSMYSLTLRYPFKSSIEIDQFEENTIKLLHRQEQINQTIKEALIESAELLPGEDITVYVLPVRPEDTLVIEKMEGISGETFSYNTIFIQIDTSFSEEILKYVVAHEYHHTINLRINNVMANYSVLDSIISEGKADSFATILYPTIGAPWTEPLSDESEALVLKELSATLDSTSHKIYTDFFKGKSSKGIPLWSNYKIGYPITQSYIKNNPDTPILKWTKLSAKEMVKGSEFKDLLKEQTN